MSTATIYYTGLSRAAGEAKDVAKKLDKYANSLENNVYKKLNKYDGSWTNNLSTARSKVDRKIEDLREEAGNYRDYAEDLNDLKDKCEEVDKAVKSRVSSLTASFKEAYGIKNSVVVNTISYVFTSIGNSSAAGRWINTKTDEFEADARYIKQSIEDWYDYGGGKEFIKGALVAIAEIAIAVVSIVGAIAGILAGGWTIALAAALIGGVIALVNGVTNLVNEGRALGYADDDPATAKRKSDLDTIQETLRVETDSEFWHAVATGIDVVNIVCTVINLVDSCGKLIKNGYKWATGSLDDLKDIKIKDILTKENFGKFFSKLKTSFSKGFDEVFTAIRKLDGAYFMDALGDFKTDFMANLKKRFTSFKSLDGLSGVDKLRAIEKNSKTLKNIFSLGKDFFKDGFDVGNILEKVVIPCINVAGVTTLKFPEGGGQGYLEFDNIKLKDIVDLKDFKTKLFDKGVELFSGNNVIASDVLDKITTPVDINISIPEIHVPTVQTPEHLRESGIMAMAA